MVIDFIGIVDRILSSTGNHKLSEHALHMIESNSGPEKPEVPVLNSEDALDLLRAILSVFLTFGIDETIDKLCTETLRITPSPCVLALPVG